MNEPMFRPPQPSLRMRPLAGGQCHVELDAVIDWGTAIELMKVLGFAGQAIAGQVDGENETAGISGEPARLASGRP
jgi:hypothetical protein